MSDFYNVAIMIIYDDGSVEKLDINDKLFHMFYFVANS